MTAILVLLGAIGLFWVIHWIARFYTRGFVFVAIMVNSLVLFTMFCFTVYGFVIGYKLHPWSPSGLTDAQAQWHIAITWIIGPIVTLISILIWAGYLINHYRKVKV